jgi:hypothetical protein
MPSPAKKNAARTGRQSSFSSRMTMKKSIFRTLATVRGDEFPVRPHPIKRC